MLLKDSGRPTVAYGRPCGLDLEHEVMVTEAELLMSVEFDRGVSVGKAVPDGVYRKDGVFYAVEVDNAAKQTRRQYLAKWEEYGPLEGFILLLCRTEARMRRLIRWAEPKKEVCLFNTFAGLKAGKKWTDWSGAEV